PAPGAAIWTRVADGPIGAVGTASPTRILARARWGRLNVTLTPSERHVNRRLSRRAGPGRGERGPPWVWPQPRGRTRKASASGKPTGAPVQAASVRQPVRSDAGSRVWLAWASRDAAFASKVAATSTQAFGAALPNSHTSGTAWGASPACRCSGKKRLWRAAG